MKTNKKSGTWVSLYVVEMRPKSGEYEPGKKYISTDDPQASVTVIRQLKKLFSKSPGKFEKSGGVQAVQNKPNIDRGTAKYFMYQKGMAYRDLGRTTGAAEFVFCIGINKERYKTKYILNVA